MPRSKPVFRIVRLVKASLEKLASADRTIATCRSGLFDRETRLDRALISPEAEAAATALYNQGFEFWRQGKLEEAIASYDAALKLRPDYPEALCAGGFLLHQAGKREQALRFYDEALRYRPDYAIALANRGKLLNELDAPEEAIECSARRCARIRQMLQPGRTSAPR